MVLIVQPLCVLSLLFIYVYLSQMLSKNLQVCILLYQAVFVAVTGEACIVLPQPRNSATVEITFNSAAYCFCTYNNIPSLVNYIIFNPQSNCSFKDYASQYTILHSRYTHSHYKYVIKIVNEDYNTMLTLKCLGGASLQLLAACNLIYLQGN